MADNPYLEAFRLGGDRNVLARQYAWAIPDDTSLSILAEHAPLIELGAGTGYWAYLLRQRNVDIIAYDNQPTIMGRNRFHYDNTAWTEVLDGVPASVVPHAKRTLFLCWPPLGESMAYETLRAYQGNTVIHVGASGLTANLAFYRALLDDWKQVAAHVPPQWPGMHDTLTVWIRRELRLQR